MMTLRRYIDTADPTGCSLEIDLKALTDSLPDLYLAKNQDSAADLDKVISAVTYAIANLRDIRKELP